METQCAAGLPQGWKRNVGFTVMLCLQWQKESVSKLLLNPSPATMRVTTLASISSNEKVLRETQTLPAGCSKADPKISNCHRSPSRGAGRQNLISRRWSLTSPTDPVW